MSDYPYNQPGAPDPYNPYAGPSSDPYAAQPPLAGTPYPGFEYQGSSYLSSQAGAYQPQPMMVSRPMQPIYDPVMAQVQQMVLMSNRTRSNALGGWALGLSIVSVLCCTYGVAQLIALGLGIAGIVAANNGHADNKGVSIAAVVISVVSMALWIAFWVFVVWSRTRSY
ncbi:Uncharacterised protein [Actinomyces bovis]|uniref:DUF4190 domain-containing protein n=1 Tax=Actinomyces bovis TaxID=1658 RepID=A0ABY1VJW3_9ACTO|nr:DUF4190 domain-containing protein [Actinomyces bovis]SPT52396.1 Uncharacterised protein [Actinomyces bovis]VEG54000.1 Uncharacterised protein [Actinomyces israelii]